MRFHMTVTGNGRRMTGKRFPAFAILVALTCLAILVAASPAPSPEGSLSPHFFAYDGYTGPQYEGVKTRSLYVKMRDGVKIAIDVMLPENLPDGEKIPAVIKLTRYWRAVEYRPPVSWFKGPDAFERFITGHGYALVYVDARGSGASFGSRPYPWSKNEIADGTEIADWIVSQPWSNGKIGTIGISYSGTSAEFLAVPNHPAIKAVIPRFADHDVYLDIAYPGGIPNEWMLKNWAYYNNKLDRNILPEEAGIAARLFVRGVKPVDADRSRRMLAEAVRDHAANGDVYKLSRAATCRDDSGNEQGDTVDIFSPHNYKDEIERSGVGVFSWGSWLDAAQGKAVIRRFMNYSNPQRAVIGPWSHGGNDHASPYLAPDTPTDPIEQKQWRDCIKFFDYFLKDIDNNVISEKMLVYYTLGEEKWKSTDVWPPAGSAMQRWYFSKDNSLSVEAPSHDSGEDSYTVDFQATTGTTNRWHTQMGGDVVYPNRAEEDRRLLTYTSPVLSEAIEITGHPVVTLYVTSTHTDGNFFVYLEDVDEDGGVTYIVEGQLRALHRKLSGDPPPYELPVPYHSFRRKDGAPLVPGKIAALTFDLHPTSVLIKKGHRIRIAIAGHDKDTFAAIPEEGTPVIALSRNKRYPSHIDLPVVFRND